MYILRSIILSNAINTVEPPIIMDTLGSGILSFKERLSSLRRLKCISIIFGTLKCVLYREVINPRRACAARVTVLGPSVCLSVCQCVHDYSRTAGSEGASERYQQLQRNKRSKIKKAILLKRRRSRSRNWHYSGPRCVTQPIN